MFFVKISTSVSSCILYKDVKHIWRGQSANTVTTGCEPGQVRKEAAVAADAGTEFQRVETASTIRTIDCDPLSADLI